MSRNRESFGAENGTEVAFLSARTAAAAEEKWLSE